MNQKAAICDALLQGKVLNIKNGFHLFGVTNVPREIGRSVERSFGVKVTRKQMDGKSRYGLPCVWVDYSLEATTENMEGIKKMIEYVKANRDNPKTDKEHRASKIQKQVAVYSEQIAHTQVDETEKWFNEYLEGKHDPPETGAKLFIQQQLF
jgi:hypothetical protein